MAMVLMPPVAILYRPLSNFVARMQQGHPSIAVYIVMPVLQRRTLPSFSSCKIQYRSFGIIKGTEMQTSAGVPRTGKSKETGVFSSPQIQQQEHSYTAVAVNVNEH